MKRLDNITDSMDMNLSKIQEMVEDWDSGMVQSPGLQRVRLDLATEEWQFIEHLLAANCFSKCWDAMVGKDSKVSEHIEHVVLESNHWESE